MQNRRQFAAGIGATALAALTNCVTGNVKSILAEASNDGKANLIDVHHHFVPPFYVSDHREHIADAAGGRTHPAYLTWTVEHAIEAMDKNGVATAVLSLTTPGVWFGDAHMAAQLARKVNEYAAELVQTYPGRFGFFAVVPLPDTESSLHEIEYAFGSLKADGIGLMTSYDDKWLGDPRYEPVFEELNRRKAVVFVHPTTGLCCRTLLPDVNPIMLEIPQDTTRAITNLLFSGSFTRFKNIRFIFTHAGGTAPMMVNRMHQYASKDVAKNLPNGIEYELRRLYYDIAGTAYPPSIAALTSLIPSSQILFGSDNPFIPLADSAEGLKQVGFSESDLQKIRRDNAIELLPRLRSEETRPTSA